MIEDIEGATSEPSRRRHVLAASLGTAAVAVGLFLTLVLSPLDIDELPRASVTAPRPSAAPLVIAAPQQSILSNIDQTRQRACVWGPAVQWILVQGPAPDPRTVRPPTIAVAIEAGTGRAIPVGDRIEATTLWMTVTCATPDASAPRVDLKTIPR
ncbi:MAG: hypothetical protein E6I44_04225 [Chloroflexi bacterium]|nr:MAG: hypothetical protein E6I44_04225 [Chloroflexota bacterium]